MAEQSKFAGALGRLKQSAPKKDDSVAPDPVPPPEKRGRGGKRSNPEYSATTFFVRKDTKRKAAQLLLDGVAPNKDLSDIVEELLRKWVSKHSNL
jgi:hypothetical protein